MSGKNNNSMKNWNASASNFYGQIMNSLAAFFGLDAEETTEAELHQQLSEAGTLAGIRAAATAEALEGVKTQMTDIETKLADLQTQFDAMKADTDAKAGKITELETQLEAVNGAIAEKEKAIGNHKATIVSLSGELATLKAGKPIDKNTPPDGSKPIEQAANTGSARVVSQEEFEKAFSTLN